MKKCEWAVGCGTLLYGIGNVMIGVGALVAVWKSTDLLNKVLEIRQQAAQINEAVKELNRQSSRISVAVDLLGQQMKELKAQRAVAESKALQKPNPTKEEVKEALKGIATGPSPDKSSVYISPQKFEGLVESLYRARTPSERKILLENSMEYKGQHLLQESGQGIKGEGGPRIDLEKSNDGVR